MSSADHDVARGETTGGAAPGGAAPGGAAPGGASPAPDLPPSAAPDVAHSAAPELQWQPLPPALESCRSCPRLVEHREAVARTKRRAYQDEEYWGRPVPGFGDRDATIVLLGLAPGAHGSNRTGRMFTGDASGDFLYPALHRAGFATQPVGRRVGDGLELRGLWITASARCVPPGNRPARAELENCRRWLEYDFGHLRNARLVVALGSIAHDSYLDLLRARGERVVKREHPFEHGRLHSLADIPGALPLLDSYHPSFQNTNTGRLTADMFDRLLARAREWRTVDGTEDGKSRA